MPGLDGFGYRPDLVSIPQERELVERIAGLDFRHFEFRGYRGRRRVISFGLRYDFGTGRLEEAAEIPAFLQPLRAQAAAFAGIDPQALGSALVSEYCPGAGIGWHRDRPVFGDVVGISLLSSCRFRLRLRSGPGWTRRAVILAPRSAYLLRGAARHAWEHSIPPSSGLRYSVTFRSLKRGAV